MPDTTGIPVPGAIAHAKLTQRVANDPRLNTPRDNQLGESPHPRMREFLIMLSYTRNIEGARGTDATRRAWKAMGLLSGDGHYSYECRRILADDAPRYRGTVDARCAAATPRARDPRCTRRANITFRVTDPATGAWNEVGYCTRHQETARAEQEAERARRAAGTIPEPVPNCGGLLLSYFTPDPDKLTKLYADCSPGWKPPENYSLRADDWPNAPAGRPHLSVVDGTPAATDDEPAHPRPLLTLV